MGPSMGCAVISTPVTMSMDAKDPVTGLPVYLPLRKNPQAHTGDACRGRQCWFSTFRTSGRGRTPSSARWRSRWKQPPSRTSTFVVLDRPNPCGGESRRRACSTWRSKSFVGQLAIPYVHGMTVGELARMINDEGWLAGGGQEVRVDRRADDRLVAGDAVSTRPGSPGCRLRRTFRGRILRSSMPRPGIMGELGVVSEGVGYPLPFELIGAPFLDAEKFAAHLNAAGLPGVRFRPIHFKPYYTANKGKVCHGVQIHLTEPARCPLTEIQFHAMDYVRRHHPDHPLFAGKRNKMFDKVCGTDRMREAFVGGKPLKDILAIWRDGVDTFRKLSAKPYLLYR
jgi:hypothetical protein